MGSEYNCLHCKKWDTDHGLRLIGKCSDKGTIRLSISEACEDIVLCEEVSKFKLFTKQVVGMNSR